MTPKTAEILVALRRCHEGDAIKKADGTAWMHVYLWNAKPAGMSAHAFAGHLSALEQAGVYRPVDGDAWGEVEMGDEIIEVEREWQVFIYQESEK